MNKLLLPAILILIALPLSAGCSKQETETVTISFLDAEDKSGAWAEVIERFEAANPGIRVNLIEGPASTDTRRSQYAAALLAGDSTYDLIYLDVIWVAKFAEAGWLVPLDERFSPRMRENYLPGDIQASVYNGSIWRVPIRSDGGMLYYRKDLLERENISPPETFDELVSASKKLQDPPDLWGLIFMGKQYEGLTCVFLEILRGFGGDVIGPENDCLLDGPESISAFTWIHDVVFKHRIVPEAIRTYEENETLAAFISGRSVFMRNWPYAWKVCQEEGSAVKGKVGIIPMVHSSEESSSATLGGWGFGISKFSRHKDEAWKFASFASSTDALKIFALKQGGAPSLKPLYKDAELSALNPHYPQLYRVLLHAEPRPVKPQYAEISDAIQRHVSAVLTRMETPEQAASDATAEIDAILRRGPGN
ncbi:MAG: ABC transporter substrate-binding protein [Candidatus Abyssobacteria bacterium SURF_5]|uniref:ABC transporter substrate-binding protein n=1 Tax=Abyssobacteria bacterium (strain SURF_5) TaxID=2093360 RepID=A0A3A4MXV5_ABYX5|nr:MAG: ABC transporter substrate-binding protein [Candidatus Abyssubacteria bacterium SURF_5]